MVGVSWVVIPTVRMFEVALPTVWVSEVVLPRVMLSWYRYQGKNEWAAAWI